MHRLSDLSIEEKFQLFDKMVEALENPYSEEAIELAQYGLEADKENEDEQ